MFGNKIGAKLKGIKDAIADLITRLKGLDAIYDLLAMVAAGQNHHEHVWPMSDGEGNPGAPIDVDTDDLDETHGGATTADFWGKAWSIITPGDIPVAYSWIGFYLYGSTINKDFQWQAFRVVNSTLQTRNGGNNWDEGATVLTVPDDSDYVVGDQISIRTPGYEPDGEVLNVTNVAGNVITIVRETSQFGAPNTGLRFNHTTGDPGNEEMYRINRNAEGLRDTTGSFAAPSSRELMRYTFHAHREVLADDGLIMRMLNETDNVSSNMAVKAIYED